MRGGFWALTGCLLAAFAGCLTGCGPGAVEVPPPIPDPATVRLCGALNERLPATLRRQSRREIRPESRLTRAWGSPAIALRCGVPRPATMRQTSQLVTVNGISWFPRPPDRPVTFTAVGRRAYVEVTVPAVYAPQGDVLVELTPAIKAALPAKPGGEL
ncbi:MAG TPA: DUF3515 domain-containing protein [Streptosporangiaceae bacterium]|nr:DUF3515 domain-containing protein [Streptosporangiaceae bacterium]